MTHIKARGRIVVGVDGSAASAAAVRWAVREARLRHATVHLVCAFDSDTRLRAPYASCSWATCEDERYAAARALLSATAELARPRLPPGRLTTELTHEPPVRALLDRAADAEMLVLGTTRFARESGQLPRPIGPVARACLRLVHCPVVVVAPDDHPPRHVPAQRHRHATPREHAPRAAKHPPKSAEPATSMLASAAR
jgi:nucleotide-binding universal stress UspA family protein